MTAAQRLSLTGLVLPFLVVGATPNATPDATWRVNEAWGYSLTASVVVPPSVVTLLRGETLSVSVVASETLSCPVVASEVLSAVTIPRETLP